jgi:CheY-like chemotaxis protein
MDLSQWNVIVVDDEPDSGGVAQFILTYHGAKVRIAPTAVGLIEQLRAERPTFVLLDLSMPRISGWEILKEVRADPALSDLPLIALTAHAMQGDTEKGMEAGFDGYITKPISLATFLPQIEAALEAAKTRASKKGIVKDGQ